MKFGQFIEYNKSNIFLQNHAENKAGRLFRDLFMFFQKNFTGGKIKWSET